MAHRTATIIIRLAARPNACRQIDWPGTTSSMTAQQPNARQRNPDRDAGERTIRADIERVWENVLDWEHLAHLHDSSFDVIELIDAGPWGWRVHSDAGRTTRIELTVADAHSYVSRSYSRGALSAEIWTHLSPVNGTTAIRVEFDLPDVPPARQEAIGQRMLDLYDRLWDEDESMMMERAHRLQETRSHDRTVALGRRDALELPVVFQLAGREYRLVEASGTLTALPTMCPHLLGPLPANPAADGTLTCPWHGYRFDVATGTCLSPATAQCRLPPSPAVTVENGDVIVRAD